MTRSTLFDRLNQELEAFGRKAQQALDEGKLQIELVRIRRQRDHVARDLGLLIHERERGGQVPAQRVDALLFRLDDLAAEIGRLERQVAERRTASKPRDEETAAPMGAGPAGPVE